MSDYRSDNDDDLSDLLTFEPFSKENVAEEKSYDSDRSTKQILEYKDQSAVDRCDLDEKGNLHY